jgi:hypothetical protein
MNDEVFEPADLKYIDCLKALAENGPCVINDQSIIDHWTPPLKSEAFIRPVSGRMEVFEITDAGRKWLSVSGYQ